jgi:hypothetical protein
MKSKKTVIEEPEIQIEEEEQQEEEEYIQPQPVKTKRVMSEKQLQALAEGRKKGVEKLRQKGNITRNKQAVHRQVKELKEQEVIQSTDELKKYADVSYIRKSVEELNNRFSSIHSKFENIDNRFNGYLSEREQRKADKQNNILNETVKKELPRAVNEVFMSQKVQKELSNNRFMGRV